MKSIERFSVLFAILVTSTCIGVFVFLASNDTKKDETDLSIYYKNHQWMFNVNVFQYSSYLVISNSSHHQFEILILLFDVASKKKDFFTCLAKSKKMDKTHEIRILKSYRLVLGNVYKIICYYDKTQFGADLDDLAVSVKLTKDIYSNEFPQNMVNFQIPTVIYEVNPRFPKVGVCVNFVPNVHSAIYNWVEMHEYFKATEIVLHDATNKLRNLLYPKFKTSFVEIRNYDIDVDRLCNTEQISMNIVKHNHVAQKYRDYCVNFVNTIFSDPGPHNHLSVNDCYASLSYKYEFVTLYDLDELILPRAHNILDIAKDREPFKCSSDLIHTCSYKPIISMYDYFKGLIKNEFKNNIEKLRSIQFHHSAYLFPDDTQALLFRNLKDIVLQIESNSTKFPLHLNTGGKNRFYHSFTIDEKDKDYAIYLSEKYDEIICLFNEIIKNKTKSLQNQWKRFVYFHTHYDQRYPKSVHYTLNVQGLFTHFAEHYTKDSIVLNPSKINGHMNSHYRNDLHEFVTEKRKSSIKNIGIDFDYAVFLIQNFTSSC
jgi:hypothetical protein